METQLVSKQKVSLSIVLMKLVDINHLPIQMTHSTYLLDQTPTNDDLINHIGQGRKLLANFVRRAKTEGQFYIGANKSNPDIQKQYLHQVEAGIATACEKLGVLMEQLDFNRVTAQETLDHGKLVSYYNDHIHINFSIQRA